MVFHVSPCDCTTGRHHRPAMGIVTAALSTVYVLASPVWMIPQIFFFSIYKLPLKILNSVLTLFGIQYNSQLLMEFTIVLYQYVAIAFIVGASFGVLNLFLFWVVKCFINWLDQLFRYDTGSILSWMTGETEKPRVEVSEKPVNTTITTAKIIKETVVTEKKEEIPPITTKPSKPKTPLAESTPTKPVLPINVEADLLSTPDKTSTTQASQYDNGSITQRARTQRPESSTDADTTISTSSQLGDEISETADTSFQTKEGKL